MVMIGLNDVWYAGLLLGWIISVAWLLHLLRLRGCAYWMGWMLFGMITTAMAIILVLEVRQR